MLVRISLAAVLLSLPCTVDAQFPVGLKDVVIQNATTVGSVNLGVRIYYPATQPGTGQPIRPQSGGYPVIVHLHGLGGRATNYTDLGEALAEAGFVAVLNDTAQFDPDLQVRDALALFPSLVAENSSPNSFFRGALNMARAGLSGHSMGGGSTVRTLSFVPEYKAGFCFAPWDGTVFGQGSSWTALAPAVAVPLAILHGAGDPTVHWQRIGFEFYKRATGYRGLKSFVLLDSAANHNNAVRLPASPSAADRAVHAVGMTMVIGWFDRHLRDGATGLENVVGEKVRKSSVHRDTWSEYRSPELWRFGATTLGNSGSLTLGGEPGNGAIYVSPSTRAIPTPFGILKLDPTVILPFASGSLGATRLLPVNYQIPNNQNLLGSEAWFQGVTDGGVGVRLSGAVRIVVR